MRQSVLFRYSGIVHRSTETALLLPVFRRRSASILIQRKPSICRPVRPVGSRAHLLRAAERPSRAGLRPENRFLFRVLNVLVFLVVLYQSINTPTKKKKKKLSPKPVYIEDKISFVILLIFSHLHSPLLFFSLLPQHRVLVEHCEKWNSVVCERNSTIFLPNPCFRHQ